MCLLPGSHSWALEFLLSKFWSDSAAHRDYLEMFVASKVVMIQRVLRVEVLNGD